MAVNQNPGDGGLRLGRHWRTVSWALLDKSLPIWFGAAFVFLVMPPLPKDEYALQGLAATMLLTLSQFFRSLCLVPLVRTVAEAGVGRNASAGAALYAGGSAITALALFATRGLWASVFQKPEFAAVLLPSAALLAVGSPRDAAISTFEAQRRLRTVFWLDLFYYGLAAAGLAAWRFWPGATRSAAAVQWAQAPAAGLGSLVAVLAARQALWVRPGRREAGRILRFGRAFLGSGFGGTLSQQADQWVAGRMLATPELAAYLAAKQLFRAFNQVAQAINQVIMPTVAKLDAENRRADLAVLFEKGVCFSLFAIIPVCAVLVVATPPLFRAFAHGRYADAARPFQILVLSALTLPLASIGSSFLTGLGRLRTLLWITWSGMALGVGLAFWWIPAHGPAGAAAATAVAALYGMVTRAAVLRPVLRFRFVGFVSRGRDAWDFLRTARRRAS